MESSVRQQATSGLGANRLGAAIIAQPVSLYIFAAISTAFMLFGGGIFAFGEHNRTEPAIGYLTPEGGVIRVFSKQPGVIKAVSVGEGSLVSKGDLLVQVRIENINGNGVSNEHRNISFLRSERQLVQEKRELLEKQYAVDVDQLIERRRALDTEIASLQQRLDKQQRIVALSEAALERSQTLANAGRESKAVLEDRARVKLSAEQNYDVLLQSRQEAVDRLENHAKEMSAGKIEHALQLNQLDAELLKIDKSIAQIEGSRIEEIVAPVDGIATSILAATGRDVSTNRPVLTLVPANNQMIAELYVSSRAAGLIEAGQTVRLSLEALPHQEFGYVPATVSAVTETIILPEEIDPVLQVTEPSYRITAKLNLSEIKGRLARVKLQPGMRATASIVIDKIRFLDRFLNLFDA